MKFRYASVILLFAWACCCGVLAVRASSLSRDGLGPIPTGRGGVNQAFSDNAEMILDNPSSMINVEGDGLIELGVATTVSTSTYSDGYGNDARANVRPLPGPVLGITKKLPGERWAVGIGLFAPAGFGAGYGQLDNPIFGPSPARSQGALVKLLPAVAYRATDRLALGFSLGIGFSYTSYDGLAYLQSGPLAGTPVLLDSEGTGVAPVGAIGMQYQLAENTRIGATYTEQTNVWMHGATNATLFDGSFIDSRFNSKIHLRWPRNLSLGIKHDLCPHRRFAVDLVWTDWSDAFSDVGLVMYDPTNPAVRTLVDSAGGSFPIEQNVPLHWTDTVGFRVGFEADLSEKNVLRMGYDYQPAPAPDSTFNPYLGGVRQHVFSLGMSHKLRHTIFNFAYQYSLGTARHVDDSALIGGQFDNSTYESDTHIATMSLSIPY